MDGDQSNAAGWLSVTAGASGSGNGTVSFAATANSQTQTRQGTLTIGGQTFTVDQAAAACTFAIAPSSLSVAANGGPGSASITAGAGCPWSSQSNDSWITITSGDGRSGQWQQSASRCRRTRPSAQRVGSLTIAGQTYTVTQAGSPCSASLSPASASVAAAGAGGSTTVTAPAGCAWTASSNATGVAQR